jgi:hypothetical protein
MILQNCKFPIFPPRNVNEFPTLALPQLTVRGCPLTNTNHKSITNACKLSKKYYQTIFFE